MYEKVTFIEFGETQTLMGERVSRINSKGKSQQQDGRAGKNSVEQGRKGEMRPKARTFRVIVVAFGDTART